MAQSRRGSVTVQEAREACISQGTRDSYTSGINQIMKWIRQTQANPDRFIDPNGNLDVEVFTPDLFEVFAMTRFNGKDHPVKVATIGGYRSAVKHVHRLRRIPVPVAYESDLKTTFSGLDRIQNDDLQHGSSRESGKRPLPYSEYRALCDQTPELNDGGFSHLFLTTQWNLMCRSASAETVNTAHLVSADDSVGCVLHKTKTNQAGHGPTNHHNTAGSFSTESAVSFQIISSSQAWIPLQRGSCGGLAMRLSRFPHSSPRAQSKNARKTYSEWTRMMKLITAEVETTTGTSVPSPLTEEEATRLFAVGFKALTISLSSQDKRDLKVCTVLKLVSEAKRASHPSFTQRPYKKRKRRKSQPSCSST